MTDFQLKNYYNISFFEAFTTYFQSVYPEFAKVEFLEILLDKDWESRELKQRTRKTFQFTENTFKTDTVYEFEKKQDFRNLTTRKHYIDLRRLVLVINGVEKAEVTFELV